MSRFLNAFRFLTILPLGNGKSEIAPEEMGRALVFFPFVGAVLGGILWVVNWGIHTVFPPGVRAAILVGLLIAMTGGLHWDGVADTFDGLAGARGERERMLSIMKDSRIGAIGVLSLCFLVVFKVILLAELPPRLWGGILILMPTAGRLIQVELAGWGRYARDKAGTGSAFVENATPRDFWVACAGVGVISLLVMGWTGLGVAALSLLYGIGVRAFFTKKLGGITGDILGMASETGEIMFLFAIYVFL